MRITEKVFQEIQDNTFNTSNKLSLVGLDGFVDKIVTPVDKRHGMGEQFEAVETIADLGSRISAAAGKSATSNCFPVLKNWEETVRSWPMPSFLLDLE